MVVAITLVTGFTAARWGRRAMTVKHTNAGATSSPTHATTVHFSRSLTRTSLTVAVLAAALVLILLLR